MMTALIALFTLFASTFGVFIGLYEDSRDKIWAYVAARALLLAVSYGAAIAVFWFAPTAWWLLWRMAAMWATFYAFAKVSFILFANPRLTARGSVLGSLKCFWGDGARGVVWGMCGDKLLCCAKCFQAA